MMKKIIQSLAFFLLLSFSSQALDASITYSTFKSPTQNYVEVYLYVVGKTVTYVPNADSTIFQAGVEVVILFKQGEDIIKFDKYNLKSPRSSWQENFVDLKRFALPDGEYQIEVSIQDNQDAENVVRYDGFIKMEYPEDANILLQSDIELLASVKKVENEEHVLVKNGYFMEPLPHNFYHKKLDKLIFYNEVYDTDKKIGDDFQVSYGIERKINNKNKPIVIGHKKRKPKPINALILQMDIKDLPSGNYSFFVEIRNRAKELLSRKTVEFTRSNPYLQATHEETETVEINDEFVGELSRKELRYSLKAIAPLVKDGDVELLNSVIENRDSTVQQRFLFNFWVNQNPNNPDITYKAFMEVAKAIDKLYADGFGYGFESDRGRVFLRYGRPNDLLKVDTEPSAPPYEIWFYNDFPETNQADVKFLFYAPELGTNYRLLHSNARGELNNPQWQLQLYNAVPNEISGSNYIDGTEMQGNMNRRAAEYFNEN
jgi:GWxTD domain-containing protein